MISTTSLTPTIILFILPTCIYFFDCIWNRFNQTVWLTFSSICIFLCSFCYTFKLTLQAILLFTPLCCIFILLLEAICSLNLLFDLLFLKCGYWLTLFRTTMGYLPNESGSSIGFRNLQNEVKHHDVWESGEGAASTSGNSRDNLASLYRPPYHLMFNGSFEKVSWVPFYIVSGWPLKDFRMLRLIFLMCMHVLKRGKFEERKEILEQYWYWCGVEILEEVMTPRGSIWNGLIGSMGVLETLKSVFSLMEKPMAEF